MVVHSPLADGSSSVGDRPLSGAGFTAYRQRLTFIKLGWGHRYNANRIDADYEIPRGFEVNMDRQITRQIAMETEEARRFGGWNRNDQPALAGLLHAAHVAIYQRAARCNGRVFRGKHRLRFKHYGRLYYCRNAWPGYLVVENAARQVICASGPLGDHT